MKKFLFILPFLFVFAKTNAQLFLSIGYSPTYYISKNSSYSNVSVDNFVGLKYQFARNIAIGSEFWVLKRNISFENNIITPQNYNATVNFTWYLFANEMIKPFMQIGTYGTFVNKYQNYVLGNNVGFLGTLGASYTSSNEVYAIDFGIKAFDDLYNTKNIKNSLFKNWGFSFELGVNLSKCIFK